HLSKTRSFKECFEYIDKLENSCQETLDRFIPVQDLQEVIFSYLIPPKKLPYQFVMHITVKEDLFQEIGRHVLARKEVCLGSYRSFKPFAFLLEEKPHEDLGIARLFEEQ